ncbi:endonuclease/exonuclease/phosphatase family protein [Rhizobium sp. YIM 134829]|uniref:endonuclease/exonuclease/phosphatase family protein n=1 Tax=Rhizobium sp. YIM 134829 TaxID=3390453 RepID=UPI0039799E60
MSLPLSPSPRRAGSDAAAASCLRIVTYNVHSCVGTDRRLDPARIAEVLAGLRPDVVALQELDVGRARSGGVDQAMAIAEAIGMASHFHPALLVQEEKYGDAILTALPSRLIKAGELPSAGEPRGALWIELMLGGRPVHVFNTHFGLRRAERLRQAQALAGPDWMGAARQAGGAIILAGDFNAIPSSAAYRHLAGALGPVRGEGGRLLPPTFPSRLPLLRLDHLFVSPEVEVVAAEAVRTPLTRLASDHLPLLAELRVISGEPLPDRAVD